MVFRYGFEEYKVRDGKQKAESPAKFRTRCDKSRGVLSILFWVGIDKFGFRGVKRWEG